MVSKLNRKSVLSKSVCKFPTVSEFRNLVAPRVDMEHVSRKMQKLKPIVPPYLRELPSTTNPFSAIKSEKTWTLKKQDQRRKEFERKIRSYPIHENVSREVRLMYNANFKLRAMKYSLDVGELPRGWSRSEDDLISDIELPRIKAVGNVDFVLETRRVCLLELAIRIKEKHLKSLDKLAEIEQAFIDHQYKCLHNEMSKEDEILKNVCEKTSQITKFIHEKTRNNNRAASKLHKVRFRLAKVTAECINLESEYLRFKKYKEFLKKCRFHMDKKNVMDRPSLLGKAEIDFFLKELEITRKESVVVIDEPTFEDSLEQISNLLNSSQINDPKTQSDWNNNEKNTNYSELKRELLDDMKTNLFRSFDNVNNQNREKTPDLHHNSSTFAEYYSNTEVENLSDSSEQVTYFKNPQDLINVFIELEVSNLSLIENVQEQEEVCDSIKKRTDAIKDELDANIDVINKQIMAERARVKSLNRELNLIVKNKNYLLKFNEVDRYKGMFYFDIKEFKSLDELMEFVSSNIRKLYSSVFPDIDSSTTSTKDMLRDLEIAVDSLYVEVKVYDVKSILQAMKKLEEERRIKARIIRKQFLLNSEKNKLKKAMDKANSPPRYRLGRPVVYRSKPEERIIKVTKEHVPNVEEEEYSFFFT